MKPFGMRLIMVALAAGLTAGCATADQQKVKDTLQNVNQDLQTVNQAVTTGLQVANQTLAEASQTVNTAAAVALQAQQLGQTAQDVANSVVHDQQILVEKGDTLWGLASRTYNGVAQAPKGHGGYLWPLICERNALTDCDLIEPGQVIRVVAAKDLGTIPASQVGWALQKAYAAPDGRK